MGTFVVALHEGPGGNDFIAKLGASSNDFDKAFVTSVKEVHGLDVTQQPARPNAGELPGLRVVDRHKAGRIMKRSPALRGPDFSMPL